MLNRYPLWKYLLICIVLTVCFLYALPNLFGDDPAVQVSGSHSVVINETLLSKVKQALDNKKVPYQKAELKERNILVRFSSAEVQLKAKDVIKEALDDAYIVALNLAPATPQWLVSMGATPMKLGLDLRGGVHFLMQVDMAAAVGQREEQYVEDIKRVLREERLYYKRVSRQKEEGITLTFRKPEYLEKAYPLLRREFRELDIEETANSLNVRMSENALKELQDYAIQQNVVTLRNRVNELGVAEPIVQRTGVDRIVVELPGVQDTAEAKRILGATATVQLHAVDYEHDVDKAVAGIVPSGSKVYHWRDGRPELLKKQIILSGDHITSAKTGYDENNLPEVSITLDTIGGKIFSDFTGKNIQKPMAVVFVERKTKTVKEGETIKRQVINVENVINVATIRQKLGQSFRITGLDSVEEARDLALLLRAGSLAAPVDIIEERTIGPSLGKENIAKGTLSVQVGFILVLIFMVFYYRVFGLVADMALALNLVLIIALLSMIPGATLTLPGIAGIVLTVGMAVDANVLIFQRIREELANGGSPQASIHAGYERAFSTIADANVTTLIAAVVLFAVGTGPVKGFAITLSIGILTSMFTAIMCTRAVVNLIYGGKKVKTLSI